MIVTLEWMKNNFEIWNAKAFDNKLPLLPFKIVSTKKIHGCFRFSRFKADGKIFNEHICMSKKFDFPTETDAITTLVHEMIHYYIRRNNLSDSSVHGWRFQEIADKIDKKFGLKTNNQKYPRSLPMVDKNDGKKRYFAIYRKKDGNRYIAKVSYNSLRYFYNANFPQIETIRFYSTKKLEFNELTLSVKILWGHKLKNTEEYLKYYNLMEDEILF